jgi:phospholipid/cholesterol/gamma-HCH transport system substrate-binding protein
MSIKAGHKVPAGTTAVVAQTSLLGENYVQLRYPDHFDPSRGPFLRSGDRIADTSVDPSIEHVAEKGIEVLAAVQSGDLAAIINTGATGLGGKGDELHRLISQLADVGDAIASQRNDLGAAVDGFGALGARLAAGAEDVGSLLDSLSRATATVTDQRSRIVDAVSGLTDLATALNERVLGPHQRQLEALVAQLRPVTATLAEDRDTLGQLLSGLAVLATRAPHAFDAYGDLILYGWFDGLRQPNGTVTPFPSSGAAAVRSLMEPPR